MGRYLSHALAKVEESNFAYLITGHGFKVVKVKLMMATIPVPGFGTFAPYKEVVSRDINSSGCNIYFSDLGVGLIEFQRLAYL